MRPESSISLSELVKYLTRHPIYPIFPLLAFMPRVSTTLYLPVAYDDITRQLANGMITTNFMHVHKVYCRSLQLRLRWWLQVTLKLWGSCTFDVHVPLNFWRRLLSSLMSWTFHGILVSIQLSARMIHLWLQHVPYWSYCHLQPTRHGG